MTLSWSFYCFFIGLLIVKYFLFQAGCGWWEGEADLVRVAPLNESELTSQLAERLSAGLHLTRAGQRCLLSINPLSGTRRARSSLWVSYCWSEIESRLYRELRALPKCVLMRIAA